MKGHKDKSGKFHPHTQYKGVRKSRDKFEKTNGVKLFTNVRKKRLISESDIDRMSDKGINALFKEVEKRWELVRETHRGMEGDGFSLVYKNKKNPSYTFEIHPMDDNETEDENGNELDEPIYHNSWYFFPAKDGKGIPNSPTVISETGGYSRNDAIREFKKEFIIFDQEFDN